MRKPARPKAAGSNKIIGYDMKHMCLLGNRLYTYCAIDPCTKQAVLRIATIPPGLNSKAALEEVVRRYGPDIVIAGDNGSENRGKAGGVPGRTEHHAVVDPPLCAEGEAPHIERFIGTFQRECHDYHYEPVNTAELQALADDRLEKYHFYRPHESPGGLTPAEFIAHSLASGNTRRLKGTVFFCRIFI